MEKSTNILTRANNSAASAAADPSPDIQLDEWVYVSDLTDKEIMTEEEPRTADVTWTDDLPVDKEFSGVGFTTNQLYKEDGYKHEDHVFEDKCFRFKYSDTCYLYGVFDGHFGTRASEFVSQRLPAEILLGQVDNVSCDEDIKGILLQAYETVEKAYFDSVSELIAERTTLQNELLHTLKPESTERLRMVDNLLESGTSALVALIINDKMYLGNVGNSRALLCSTHDGRLSVEKLNVDHTLENDNEVERLIGLGVPREHICKRSKFSQQLYTRCIGDYSVKGGYKDNELISMATSEPVTAIPEVSDAILLDESVNFVLLMTDGVYRSLTDATSTEHVNADIASFVASEFPRQSTLHGVAQAVLDKITRIHHDAYDLAEHDEVMRHKCRVRDDMTLLIRNVNSRLKSTSPAKGMHTSTSKTLVASPSTESDMLNINPFFPPAGPTPLTMDTLETLDSELLIDNIKSLTISQPQRDADNKIPAHVKWDTFNAALAAMSEKEREAFEKELVPKMDCETIPEHPDH